MRYLTKFQRAGYKAYHRRFENAILSMDVADIIELSTSIHTRIFNWEYETDSESLICQVIGPTTWKSFCSFGDRKQATDRMILCWIRNDGEPLDLQAMWLSNDSGKEFHPSQFSDFMKDYDGGCNDFGYHKETNQLRAIFKEITGFNWTSALHKYLVDNHSYLLAS